LIEKFYQDVPASDMGENETFYANTKTKKLVGFKPTHHWRMYVDG
jgi:hypothetical protein